jgi:hypothetical protein
MEQENDEHHDQASYREIDIKAPSPGDVRGEGTAHQRAKHRCYPKHGPKEALVHRSFRQWDSVDNNDELIHHGVSKFDEKDDVELGIQEGGRNGLQ